jgi:hypothetical protein
MSRLFRGLALAAAVPVLLVLHLADACRRRSYRRRHPPRGRRARTGKKSSGR